MQNGKTCKDCWFWGATWRDMKEGDKKICDKLSIFVDPNDSCLLFESGSFYGKEVISND